jgi:CRP-like cAMP-binding protein
VSFSNIGLDGDISVLATLTSGAYFGEIALLNMCGDSTSATTMNRRTASVISVGYTHLLCLSKRHINEVHPFPPPNVFLIKIEIRPVSIFELSNLQVLEDYPLARERLQDIARKRIIEKDQYKITRRQQQQQQQQQKQRDSAMGSCASNSFDVNNQVGEL